MEELMEGRFEYAVVVERELAGGGWELETIGVLGAAGRAGQNRAKEKPAAWKGIHGKILNSLPLMDNKGGRVDVECLEEGMALCKLRYEYVGGGGGGGGERFRTS
jgi:hypothetical protein